MFDYDLSYPMLITVAFFAALAIVSGVLNQNFRR
jgi:hypothetical protein